MGTELNIIFSPCATADIEPGPAKRRPHTVVWKTEANDQGVMNQFKPASLEETCGQLPSSLIVIGFIHRNCRYKLVTTQLPHNAGLAQIP